MTSTTDDWETAEIQLRHIQLEETKPTVFIAPRVEQPVIPEREVAIDDALITACENPRERMVVLQIEDSILSFVRSLSEKVMEFPSGLNSFRRMVVYRVADRFSLLTEQVPVDFNEKILRLVKTPTTCIPRPLLIDFRDQSPTGPSVSTNNRLNASLAESAATANSPTVAPASSDSTADNSSSSSKKVLLMKRKPAENASSLGKNQGNKPQLTAEDREKAYLEARARIFGDAVADGTSTTPPLSSTSSSPKPGATSLSSDNLTALASAGDSTPGGSAKLQINNMDTIQTATSPVTAGAAPTLTAAASSSSSGKLSPATSNPTGNKRSTSGNQMNSNSSKNNSSGTNNTSGNSSSNMTRAQLRDMEAEKADPDFVRRNNSNRRAAPNYYDSNSGGSYTNTGGYGQSYPAAAGAGRYPAAAGTPAGYYAGYDATQSGGNGYMYPAYYHQNAGAQLPPPPSLVTPSSAGNFGGSGGHSPAGYYGNYGYDTTGYSGGYGAGYYPPPQMTTPNTYPPSSHGQGQGQSQSQGQGSTYNYSTGSRPPPSSSQTDFPPLR